SWWERVAGKLRSSYKLCIADSALYRKVFALAESATGKTLPRAVLPGIALESPKITRKLTTAWFAKRVDERYQRCMARVQKR
ncbi:DUF1615 family protein, partial [Pseudomonas aeruginosa]|uniref:DUF1615 family protein n=1 Tax=Pseudomonas aeruginosa TaxID=287 RepID=UPI003968711B